MENELKFEHFDLSETDKLLSFLQVSYQDDPRHGNYDFWSWHFAENPLTDAKKMPIWLAKSGDEIAGQLAAIPVELNVAGETRRAMWILDFIVAPEFRRRGIGKRIVLTAQEFCQIGLGVNTMEQHAPALLQKLGWKIVGKIPRYYKMLFPGEALREISKTKIGRAAVNFGFAPFRPRPDRKNLSENKNLRFIERFDDAFDNLWQESKDQWTCAVRRDAKMLDWQYARQPGKKFDILGYYDKDKLLGYVVLFFRKPNAEKAIPKAAVTDIFYHPKKPLETIDNLLQGALQLAVERRAGGLVIDVIDSLIEKRLGHFGFRRVKSPLQLMVKSEINQDLLYDAGKWFLTRGDADISIFEEPNL